MPTPLPWARPRHELLLLALIAVATLILMTLLKPKEETR